MGRVKKIIFHLGSMVSCLPRILVLLRSFEKINPDAYRLKLPSHVRTTDVFNVKHLIPFTRNYLDDDAMSNSRPNFLSPRGNDVDQAALAFMEEYDRRGVRT